MSNNEAQVFIIAEAGVNHDGSLDQAHRLVDIAADAGADAVKFQTFHADKLVTSSAPKAEYQARATSAAEGQMAMLKRLELSEADHCTLAEQCADRGIGFLSSPFDEESVRFLVDGLDLPMLKIASGDITHGPLLLCAARTGKKIILSTGMCMLDEVHAALGVLAFGFSGRQTKPGRAAFKQALKSKNGQQTLKDNVTLLQCTTEYPAPVEDVNLRAMDTLAIEFGLPVGLSDHTPGIAVPIAAAARGACVIEKHFTLDRSLSGPDHAASLAPEELFEMVRGIRLAEAALGSGIKKPAPSELGNRAVARRHIVANRPVARGHQFTDDDLAVKRTIGGLDPMRYWDILGEPANRDYCADEEIDRTMVES